MTEGSIMSTTIEINDKLLRDVQQLAQRRNLTLQQVVESALQSFLKKEQDAGKAFHLRKHSFRGNGVQLDVREGDWAKVRERIYEGQGG